MNDPGDNRIWELAWRRQLTDAEKAQLRAWLASHPDAQADWEAEMQLTGAVTHLRNVPVPSNFTAQVMESVQRESARPSTAFAAHRFWWLHKFIPRAAMASLLGVVLGLGFHQHTQTVKRQAVAQGLAAMSDVDSLQNFDTIRKMPQAPAPDTELLALMQ